MTTSENNALCSCTGIVHIATHRVQSFHNFFFQKAIFLKSLAKKKKTHRNKNGVSDERIALF